MNDSQSLDFAVSNFISLETQLSRCIDYIPFVEANLKVVSPKFIPIILDSCSLIDSIFSSRTKNRTERFNLKRYSEHFEEQMELEDTISLFLSSPIRPLRPFAEWTRKPPDWWSSYNSLKHDRLGHYEVATITNAVNAMAALHQVLSRTKEFSLSLLRIGWIDTNEFDTVVEISSVEHLGPLHPRPASIVIESQLFVSSARDNFVSLINDETFSFDYTARGISNRLRNLLFASENAT